MHINLADLIPSALVLAFIAYDLALKPRLAARRAVVAAIRARLVASC